MTEPTAKPLPRKTLERMDQAWDRMSADYGARLNLSPESECYLQLAAQVPPSQSELKILSLGTDPGFELDSLLQRVPQARLTCLDVSGKMLERLQQRLAETAGQMETIQASYVNYPIPEESFDLIVSSKTVHHLLDDVKVGLFQAIRQGLSQDGLYLELDDVCTKENMVALRQNFEQQAGVKEGGDQGEWNQNINVTVERELELLQQAGFSAARSPWSQLNENGYGVAVFVCQK